MLPSDDFLHAIQQATWQHTEAGFFLALVHAVRQHTQMSVAGLLDAKGNWLASDAESAQTLAAWPGELCATELLLADDATANLPATASLKPLLAKALLLLPITSAQGEVLGAWLLADTCVRDDMAAIRAALAGLAPRLRGEILLQRQLASAKANDLRRADNTEAARTLRELEALTYAISHSLEVPLRAVQGFSTILQEDYAAQLDDAARNYLARIVAAAQRMDRLTANLLSLSKISLRPLNIGKIDLARLTQDVVDDMKKAGVPAIPELQMPPVLIVHADPGVLRLVLECLLVCAMTLTRNVNVPQITLGSSEHNGRKAYFLRDNGLGFDIDAVERSFTLAQGVDELAGRGNIGTGIAVARRLLHRLHGGLQVDSAVGAVTTFYFWWPPAPELMRLIDEASP